MTPRLEQEIRDLRSRFWSERDPQGRGFVPLADALRRAQELDEALEVVADGLARHPDFASAHLVHGWVQRDRGEEEEAEAAFRRVLEMDPENARALYGLGQILAQGGRLAAGRDLVARALDLDPLLDAEEAAPAPGRVPAADAEPDLAVMDIRSLAPESPDGILGHLDGGRPLVDIAFLAPHAPEAPPDASMSPDGVEAARTGLVDDPWAVEGAPAVAGPVVDIGALAPAPVVDIAALAPDPDPPVVPDPADGEEGESDEDEVLYTRTMFELMARQGLHDEALAVARRLLAKNPGDDTLRRRVVELEASGGAERTVPRPSASPPPPPAPLAPETDEPGGSEGVTEYLRDLLSWSEPDDPEAGA